MARSWGRQFETEVLNRCGTGYEKVPLIGFHEAVWRVFFKQPNDWDPRHPSTAWGRMLLDSVRAGIDSFLLNGSEKRTILSNLGLYTAVGTAADLLHHTDAVVVCDIGYTMPFVTVDLKWADDGVEIPYPNHVVVERAHFISYTTRGDLRLKAIGGVIADMLLAQLFGSLEEVKAS